MIGNKRIGGGGKKRGAGGDENLAINLYWPYLFQCPSVYNAYVFFFIIVN